MSIIVVDASVVVKWYVIEDFRDQALALRDDYINGLFKLASPTLMPFEVINAVRYSRKDISPATLKAIMESLVKYGFELYELKGEYADLTIDTALENNITIYDASYVALAEYLNTTLYTADEKLIESLNKKHRKAVKHIKDYKQK
ncbi:MAG: PIN domain nuclease [Thermoprotei archaeon]|mgnify:CR=1 FL=1|nr:MAG: PIN domain nuclease [Thermoprotei archaeon]